jgi:hypothetical protein
MLREILRAERRQYYGRFVRAKIRRLGGTITRPFGSRAVPETSFALSKGFVDPLASILARNVPVLLLYGSEDEAYQQFLAARDTLRTLPGYDGLVDEMVLDGDVHGFGRVAVQRAVVDACVEWIANLRTGSPAPERSLGSG